MIETRKDGKRFNDALRKVMHYCISHNVSIENLEEIVRYILKTLAKKSLSSFPDYRTCCRMVREMRACHIFMLAQSL